VKLALLAPKPRGTRARVPSGGDLYDRELCRALAARGHAVQVVPTLAAHGHANAERLAAQLLAARYDAVLQDELGHVEYLSLNRQLNRQVGRRLATFALVHVTTAELEPGKHSAARERAFLESVDDVVFVSRHVRERTRKLLGLSLRGLVLPPGCDHLPLRARKPRSTASVTRFLCVAHLLPHKGQLELIELWSQLPKRATLWLAGDATRDRAYAKQVERAAERCGPGRVRLLGPLEPRALVAAYGRADVFVSASRYESYGLAIAEALVHGLPVVTWTKGGLWELLTPDESALRVRPDDRAAFAAALSRVCLEPRLLARLQRGARAAGKHLPDWNTRAATLETWLKRRLEV